MCITSQELSVLKGRGIEAIPNLTTLEIPNRAEP